MVPQGVPSLLEVSKRDAGPSVLSGECEVVCRPKTSDVNAAYVKNAKAELVVGIGLIVSGWRGL